MSSRISGGTKTSHEAKWGRVSVYQGVPRNEARHGAPSHIRGMATRIRIIRTHTVGLREDALDMTDSAEIWHSHPYR